MLKNLYRQLTRSKVAKPHSSFDVARAGELVRAGDTEAARAVLAGCLRADPLDAQALHMAGLIELSEHQPAAAAAIIARAVASDPHDPIIRANLGLALGRCGKLEQARDELESAVRDAPTLVAPTLNLIDVHLALGDPLRAHQVLRNALAHGDMLERADAAGLWLALAGLEPFFPQIDGPACFRQAALLDPDSATIPILGYMAYARRCDWSFPSARLVAYLEQDAAGMLPAATPLLAPAVADCVPASRRARFAVARRSGATFVARVAPLAQQLNRHLRRAGQKRIRLGYLSADFHTHPSMHLLRGVLASHERSRFELFAYSLGASDGSDFRDQVMALFDQFADMALHSPLTTAQRIIDDDIDILIDLNGYAGAGRPEIAALRPAPIQVSFLGYPGTVAAGFIDYLIADPVLVRPGDESWYSEHVVYLPYCYQPTDNAQRTSQQVPTRAELGLPPQGFVFCSFNSCYKIEPRIFGVWMEILHAVPGSVLWILAERDDARANLVNAAGLRGIEASRLIFAGPLPRDQHLARMSQADLFLDTHYVNAHTTASDAIWAGLPLITASGDSFSSRVAASILCAAGLDELACATLESYSDLAIALAHDRSRMDDLRRRCVRARSDGPLFDTHSYTRHLEAAYSTMHTMAQSGAAPAAFCVPRQIASAPC